jgi:hypothetical protein
VSELGKVLMMVGLVVAAIGLLLWSGLGKDWFGRLPGDISHSRGNFKFYFPFVTCLVLSLVMTLILWLITIFRK